MKLILDTNIVLDWLVFGDPAVNVLQVAIETKRVELVAHALTLGELTRVLAYTNLRLDSQRQQSLFEAYRRQVHAIDLGSFARDNLQLPKGFPVCGDSDDQPFIALAYHAKAILVSKDKAILKLRKRASRFDVRIVDVAELTDSLTSTKPNA